MDNPLDKVLTVPEVAKMWGYREETVHYAMGAKKRPLVFRRAGKVFLIEYASCVRRWGQPIREISTVHLLPICNQ